MNVNIWPPCVPKSGWQEIRPLVDLITIFAEDLVNCYRAEWDSQTPKDWSQQTTDAPKVRPGGREWYLRRDTGLRAFARREAELRMKHFAKDGQLTGADFCEARLQEVIFKWGWKEALFDAPPRWQKFISWRKRTAPGFASRCQLWISRSNRQPLASHSPDTRIKLYALLYDRAAPVPLEFCSEDYSASALSECTQGEKWPGKRVALCRENVRRWRRDLGLKLSRHVVVKFCHPRTATTYLLPTKETGVDVDHAAAKKIGLPFDFRQFKELSPRSAG